MTQLGAAITVILCLLVGIRSRHCAVVAIILGVCSITQGQTIDFLGSHLTAIRLVLLAGLIRVAARGELRRIKFTAIDRTFLTYTICLVVIPIVRVGTMAAVGYQFGVLYNMLLSYFVFRALLNEEQDIRGVILSLSFMMLPFALVLLRESVVGSNVFAIFGGVPELSVIRDDNMRAQGPFRSPITAGAFGATFAMLFASLLFARVAGRWRAIVGLVACTSVVICAQSSGPLLGALLGLLAFACWPLREHTRKILWGILATLVCLHLVMKAPVWFLLSRIGEVVGGGGWHRAAVIDRFIDSASSWLLIGMSDTSSWMATELEGGGADITNQFVWDGINAGLIGLILSITLVVRCFQCLGRAMQKVARSEPGTEKLLWGLASTLVGSVGILFSVTYFDQMHVVWYFLLACIATTTSVVLRETTTPGAAAPPAWLRSGPVT
jgi:hypothetical protein